MKKITFASFFLVFLAIALQSNVVPMPELMKPENIVIDKDLILITEFPHVYIFSLKDFKLIKKIGKQGEGPREFAGYVRIQKDPEYPDRVVVGSHMKMTYFSTDGNYIEEKRAKGSAGNVYKPFGKNYVSYGFYQDQDTKTAYQTIDLYNANLKKIKRIYQQENVFQQGREINALGTWGAWFRIYEDKIFVTGEKDGAVLVYNDKGDKLYEITHEYDKMKVTQKDRDRYHNFFKTDPQTRQFYDNFKDLLVFPAYFPSIRGMDVVDGKVYINSYLREDGTTDFTIFDIGGNLLKEHVMLTLPEATARDLYPYTIYDDNLFQLVDNPETEEWELRIIPIK